MGIVVQPLRDPELARMTSGPRSAGFFLIIGVIAFFTYWSWTAPLEGAVVASGSIVVDSNRKTVQHLEGGIIEKILVRNGDIVKKGDKLVILDKAIVGNKRDLSLWNLHVETANKARLVAERDGLKDIPFDTYLNSVKRTAQEDALTDTQKKELENILAQQRNMFKQRTQSVQEQGDILNKRISQLNNQIDGLRSQHKSTMEQIALIRDEMGTVKALLERGLEQKPRLLGLQRREAELQGSIGEYVSSIAKTQDTINETRLQMTNVRTERQKEIAEQLKETDAKIAEHEENYRTIGNVYNRTEVLAPQDGKVTSIKYYNAGAVVAPGAAIMEIVPQNDELVVDVKLKPTDIESVFMKQKAQVMLSAYLARHVPKLNGEVTLVSADRMQDEHSGEFYYQVRVKIFPEELTKLADIVTLYPGMPAEVFLVTGERTLFEYLLFPIQSSMNRAFRE